MSVTVWCCHVAMQTTAGSYHITCTGTHQRMVWPLRNMCITQEKHCSWVGKNNNWFLLHNRRCHVIDFPHCLQFGRSKNGLRKSAQMNYIIACIMYSSTNDLCYQLYKTRSDNNKGNTENKFMHIQFYGIYGMIWKKWTPYEQTIFSTWSSETNQSFILEIFSQFLIFRYKVSQKMKAHPWSIISGITQHPWTYFFRWLHLESWSPIVAVPDGICCIINLIITVRSR